MRYLILALLPILLPFLGLRRGLPTLLALAAFGWLLFGLVQFGILSGFVWAGGPFSKSNTLHDTYYVVGHFHYLFGVAAVLGLLALVARMTAPNSRLETTAFWGLQIGLALSLLPQLVLSLLQTPDASPLDLARQFETVNLIALIGGLVALLSAFALLVLLVIRVIRWLGRR